MDCPPELKRRYQEGRLIPFIGAGISMSVQWESNGVQRAGPSWKELVDYAATELGFTSADLARMRATDLQILEYYKLKNHENLAPFRNWLVTRLQAPDEALLESAIHTSLAQLTNTDTFYTTNFDDFLERSLRLNGRPCKSVVVEANMQRQSGITNVVKFHGDLNNPEEMVISETQYEQRLRLANVLDHRFRADILANALLFVGYSFRDPNVSYLFTLFANELGRLPDSDSGMRAYITAADPSDMEKRLFRARNMEVVPIRTSEMSGDIAALLNELRA